MCQTYAHIVSLAIAAVITVVDKNNVVAVLFLKPLEHRLAFRAVVHDDDFQFIWCYVAMLPEGLETRIYVFLGLVCDNDHREFLFHH